MKFPQKLIIESPYCHATTLLGIYQKKLKYESQRDIYTPIFIEALVKIAKIQKQTNP